MRTSRPRGKRLHQSSFFAAQRGESGEVFNLQACTGKHIGGILRSKKKKAQTQKICRFREITLKNYKTMKKEGSQVLEKPTMAGKSWERFLEKCASA